MKSLNIKSNVKKFGGYIVGGVAAVGTALGTAITALADTNEGVSAATTLMNAATQELNITNMVAIISAGIGAVLGLLLAWWGARKLFRMLKGAAFKGKASL